MFPKYNKYLIVLFIIVIALIFRLPQLSDRPMHGDEAVNAVKFSQLMESGKFIYDPFEYHGPSLYYFTLPASWISGNLSFKELHETTLRIVPVIFGLGLILLLFIFGAGVNWYVLCVGAILSAISPSIVYYSRYYIHEILLVFFCYLTIASIYRYCVNKKIIWLFLASFSLGLMITTKETWVIIVFMILMSLGLTFIPFKDRRSMFISYIKSIPLKHFLGCLVVFILTIFLFYTSFLQHPSGIIDSLSAYSIYIQRAGSSELHIHPWYMYFNWLLCFGGSDGFFWSEGIIAIFALIGIIGIVTKNKFTPGENIFFYFMLLFVLSTTFIFSLIPYKTPWNFLTFWFGFIFIASVGFIYILHKLDSIIYKVVFLLFSFMIILHLGWQSYQLNYPQSHSVGNPYVYAHPVDDVIKITEKLENLALHHPDGHNMYIQVIAGDNDYWPFPWYLRNFERVGWWDRVDSESATAPVIIAKADMEDDLIHKLYQLPPPGKRHLYLPLFEEYIELRPGIEIRGYLRKDVSDILNTISDQPIEIKTE